MKYNESVSVVREDEERMDLDFVIAEMQNKPCF